MEELFRVINLDDKDKIGNLNVESHNRVKSTKYFPIYEIDGRKMIFKPLSRTKPYTTPFFAYSEVFWSYIIQKYFDPRTPRYYLAVSNKIVEEQPKYYPYGVLVESLTPNDEKIISLYDYFCDNPDDLVHIKGYTNYCMVNYYYTDILNSEFVRSNREVGENLSLQILLSLLRQDQNYHYENVNFFEDLSVAPPIDFEFSTHFMFPEVPDDSFSYNSRGEQWDYIFGYAVTYLEDKVRNERYGRYLAYPLRANICAIVREYPELVLDFIKKLDVIMNDLPNIVIDDPDNYIGALNSNYWKVGYAYFKDQNMEEYERLKREIILKEIDKEAVFKRISDDVLKSIKFLSLYLKMYLLAYYEGIENLEHFSMKELLTKLNITDDVMIEDIDIHTKKLKLIKVVDNQFYYNYYGRKLGVRPSDGRMVIE